MLVRSNVVWHLLLSTGEPLLTLPQTRQDQAHEKWPLHQIDNGHCYGVALTHAAACMACMLQGLFVTAKAVGAVTTGSRPVEGAAADCPEFGLLQQGQQWHYGQLA
jgi:hypothetical protein